MILNDENSHFLTSEFHSRCKNKNINWQSSLFHPVQRIEQQIIVEEKSYRAHIF